MLPSPFLNLTQSFLHQNQSIHFPSSTLINELKKLSCQQLRSTAQKIAVIHCMQAMYLGLKVSEKILLEIKSMITNLI